MRNQYDEAKNQENIAKHGISFEEVDEFDWNSAVTKIDNRFNYDEVRFISYGMKDNRLHVLIWTDRGGMVRPISFRKANSRERKIYEEEKNT